MSDWNTIREEYITGSASQRELAKKHGVSQASINRRSRSEKWDESRESFRIRVNQKAEEAAVESYADRIALLMSGGAKAARLLIRNLENMEASGGIRPYEIKATIDAMKGIKDLYKTDDGDDPDDNLNTYLEGMKNA